MARIDTATKRAVRNGADEHAAASGYRFDEARAEHVVEFFGHLRHYKGERAGERFEPTRWQADDVLRPLFGWVDGDGNRRFRIAYVSTGKKNGKSTLAGGIGLYLLAGDGEQGAQVYCAAADREQAGIVYREASTMAQASPLLRDYIVPRDYTKHLALPSANAFLKVVSRDHYSAEGLDVHGLIFDELHAQRTRELWDALRFGGAARRQPLIFTITTAGFDRHSICREVYEHAKQVLDGTLHDDRFFAYIAEAAEDDDWTDPATWRKANPSIGVTVQERDLAADCEDAKRSPARENVFRRYRLNQWTEQETRWLPMDKWNACAAAVDPAALRGRPCYAGLDLSTSTDLTALVLLFPDDDGYTLLPFFWAPRENARLRAKRDRVPYIEWGQEGHIRLTEGDVTDYAVVRRDVNDLGGMYPIQQLAIDRVFQGAQLATELGEDGFNVIAFGQGFMSMAAPAAEFERLVLACKLRHGAHPVLDWMARNVAVEQDAAGNIKPSKAKSTERIDGIVSAVMALGVAAQTPAPQESVYETRGVIVL